MDLTKSEMEALTRGGFDLTPRRVIATKRLGASLFKMWDDGSVSFSVDGGRVVQFMDRQMVGGLRDWLSMGVDCICAEYDGKGLSTCGVPCPVHLMRAV